MIALTPGQELYFDVCREHITRQFGQNIAFEMEAESPFMTIPKVVSAAGDAILHFDAHAKAWSATENTVSSWNIADRDNAYVSFPEGDPEDGALCLKVGHPREVAELMHLFVNPTSCSAPDGDTQYVQRALGELVRFHAVIPFGQTWRAVDPSAIPSGEPADFRGVFFPNLTQDWDKLMSGESTEAWRFADRWPEYIKRLPTATECLQGGYTLDQYSGCVRSALHREVNGPTGSDSFLDMVLVPLEEGVSAMYLRELLNSDTTVSRNIQEAYTVSSGLEALMAALKAVKVSLPSKYHHQIRVALEHQALRRWLLYTVKLLANQRDVFRTQGDKHWHVAHVLQQLLGDIQLVD